MNPNTAKFIRLLQHPVKFGLFLLLKLPSAFFSGVRIREVDGDHCIVSVPYKWFSQNPFRSTYFACQAMAAEMSTGVLGLAHVAGIKPPVSMLVVNMEATFFKKAIGRTYFTCQDGALLAKTIEESIVSGEGKTCRAISTGRNEAGEVIAEFAITWSYKQRK